MPHLVRPHLDQQLHLVVQKVDLVHLPVWTRTRRSRRHKRIHYSKALAHQKTQQWLLEIWHKIKTQPLRSRSVAGMCTYEIMISLYFLKYSFYFSKQNLFLGNIHRFTSNFFSFQIIIFKLALKSTNSPNFNEIHRLILEKIVNNYFNGLSSV